MKRMLILCLLALAVNVLAQPYPVGHRTITFVDSARGNRNVAAELYYPAVNAGENTPVAAPPAAGFPVIAFGHGFLLPTSAYQYLWNGIVPEGFVIALPSTENGFAPSHEQFGFDLAFLTRMLKSENSNNASPFFGVIAAASCVMGHSMGGGASFLAAASDTSVTAIANFAAAETNPSAIAAAANIEVPALVFAASGDCVTPPESNQVPMFDALASDCKTYVNITGGSHCKFGENSFTCNLGEFNCTGTISRTTQQQIVLFHLLPFLKFYLLGESAANCEFQDGLEGGAGITWERTCQLLPAPILSITTVGSEVCLRWSPIAGACGYELLMGAQADFAYDPLLRIYEGNNTTYFGTPVGNQAVYRVWAK